MEKALNDLLKQLAVLLEINGSQKEKLLEFVRSHEDYDPIFRHDIVHHCMLIEKLPERFDGENDFDYKTRLLQCRRRMDGQNRLGGCLLMAIEEMEKMKKQLEK
jgi:hypothetical protein